MRRGLFVFCVCGDPHAAKVNLALRFLKRFSKAEILIVAARSEHPLLHDQVLRPSVPPDLNNHEASIYLKIMLPQLVGDGTTCCYLDSDQIATSDAVDEIFDLYCPPITFASDNGSIDEFSRYAVRCSCDAGACEHLRMAMLDRFGINIKNGRRAHWNGGLYLFDSSSLAFSRAWHNNTLLIFDDPYWRTRDQGTLIATQWQLGLEDHPILPCTATRIVDRFYGYPERYRAALSPHEYYQASEHDDFINSSAFIHFINGGAGCRGWRCWDRVEELLMTAHVHTNAW